jgi:hypothetical protein
MDGHRTGTQGPGKERLDPYRVRLPGFVTGDEVGLGDAVKKVTYALGVRSCGGCERRAATLNQWLVFTRR